MASFVENIVGLIVGLERGVLPKLETLEGLLDNAADARSEDTTKMGPDLWSLCTKLDKELGSRLADTEDFNQIYCTLHLLTFRLYQAESETMDIQSGLTLFLVALKSLGQLIKHHWTRPSTAFGNKVWSPKTYDELLTCLSTVFKVVLQQSFLFKSGSPELLQHIFTYHIVELKLLFVQVYESEDSATLLDRLAYAASFYRKSDQQDAIINLVLEGVAIRPYRQSLYKTNSSLVDRIFRILKQMFELKAASKQSLANLLRTFADASILTALMKTPISVGYSIEFCIAKSQELYPWPLADAILRIKRMVHTLITTKPTPTSTDSCQQIDSIIQDALDACSRSQDVADIMFAGLSNVLSFLAETGFLSSAVRTAKSIIDRSLTGLLMFRAEIATKNRSLFRLTQPKDNASATEALRNNQLYVTKIVCVISDIVILTERTVDWKEVVSVLPVLGGIIKNYVDDSDTAEYKEMTTMLQDRLFYLLTALLSRGDVPCLKLLEFVHSIESSPRSIILVVQYALTEIETLCNRIKLPLQGSSSSFLTSSQDAGEAIKAKEVLATLFGQSASLLRDVQHCFNDKSIPSSSLTEEYGVTRYEFYYLFVSILLYGQDVDSAIQLTKHVTSLLEVDEDLQIPDFEVLAAMVGLFFARQHTVGVPLANSSMAATSILAAMLLMLARKYLSICPLHNKYLKLLIEYSAELVHELIQTGALSPEVSCKMFAQAREIIELYTDKVGVGRLMPHELEILQRALYKLFIAGQSSFINKDRRGDSPVSLYDIIVLYRILLDFTTAIEEREPPIKRSFFATHGEDPRDPTDSLQLSTPSQRQSSQGTSFVAPSFTETNINLNVGSVLYKADFTLYKGSTIKQNIFLGLVCQYVLSWTVVVDEQLDMMVSLLSTLGNYLSVMSEAVDSRWEPLQTKVVRCGTQSLLLIPISYILKLSYQLTNNTDATVSQTFVADVPLVHIMFHYAVLLVLATAKMSLVRREKYNTVFTATLADIEGTENWKLLARLIDHTLRLTIEIDCGSVTALLLEKYKLLDPVSCAYTYIMTSSRIEADVLVTLLNTLAEAGERDPNLLTNEKVQQIITQLDKGPVQNAALNQLLMRLKRE